ncbi:hypothetical protein GALMADRAFT_136986 [Galerina marginata CBS 339.88]|uniref:Uncharacterized protein n=1 Tax=Galerina marginata (strain CBS 339.88) TaxID=685588 RepID=A0A067TJE4_GALM3|nr:hypothetical protein GALMADRAFT_136986 [Galerina marginata CBS 339.88]
MVLMTFHAPGFQSLKAEDGTLVNNGLHTWFPECKGPKYTFKPLEVLKQHQN